MILADFKQLANSSQHLVRLGYADEQGLNLGKPFKSKLYIRKNQKGEVVEIRVAGRDCPAFESSDYYGNGLFITGHYCLELQDLK